MISLIVILLIIFSSFKVAAETGSGLAILFGIAMILGIMNGLSKL